MPRPSSSSLVDVHAEEAGFSWRRRDNAVLAPNFRLIDLVRLDERVEASIGGLRVVRDAGWKSLQRELQSGAGSGDFFAAGVLAIEKYDITDFEGIIEQAYAVAR